MVEVRGLAVPGDGAVPGPTAAELAIETGDDTFHFIRRGGDAITQLEKAEENRLG